MRTPLRIASLVCLVIAGFIGLDVIALDDHTPAAQILLTAGWAAWGGACYVASHLVGDWP